MKLRKKIAVIAVTIMFSLAVIANAENFFSRNGLETTKTQIMAQSNHPTPTPTPNIESAVLSETEKGGVDIADKLKSLVKEKDTSWKLTKEYNTPKKASLFEWKSENKGVSAHIKEFDSVEKAKKNIDSIKDPHSFATQIHVPLQPQTGLGDEAYWRDAYPEDSFTQLKIRSGRYVITLDGEKEDILHFATRTLNVINSN